MKHILMVFATLTAIVGCERDKTAVVRRELHRLADAYESADRRLPDYRAGVRLIDQLQTEEQRRECRNEFVGRLFSADLGGLPLERQARAIDAVLRVSEMIADAVPHDGDGWTVAYEICMKRFDWWKSQILRVKSEAGRTRTVADSGCPVSDADKNALYRICHAGVEDFEAQLNDMECLFLVRKKQMPEEEWNLIKGKMEAWLGRPLRSREQLKSDCKERRRVVFPVEPNDYVSTLR